MRRSEGLKSSARRAAIVAPWTVVPIVALALKGGPHLGRVELFVSGLFVGALVAVPLTYLAVLLLGYPAYRLLLAYDRLCVWTLIGAGTTIGALCGWLLVGRDGVLLCGGCGCIVASTAWLMIRRDFERSALGASGADVGA